MSSTDYLEEDPCVEDGDKTQNFCCISFLSPDTSDGLTEIYRVMCGMLQGWNPDESEVSNVSEVKKVLSRDMAKFVKNYRERRHKYDENDELDGLIQTTLQKLSFRAVKVRGSYKKEDRARARCGAVRELDPNFNVFVGEVGKWLPLDPDVNDQSKVKSQEYYESELQTMMKGKMENQKLAKQYFEERKKELVDEMMEKNKEESNETPAIEDVE